MLVEPFKANKKAKVVVVDSDVDISSEDDSGTKMTFKLSLMYLLSKEMSNQYLT